MKTVNFRLKKKMNEVFFIEPNDLGWPIFNNYYRIITDYLKSMPFLIIIPLSFLLAIILYIVFDYLLIKLVSLLQHGF